MMNFLLVSQCRVHANMDARGIPGCPWYKHAFRGRASLARAGIRNAGKYTLQ
jgi:hypothetical protein